MVLGVAGAVGAQHAADIFRMKDANGDGTVDREEWMLSARDTLMEGAEPGLQTDKAFRSMVYDFAGSLFDACDVNQDGVLNEVEIEFAQFLASEAAEGMHAPDGASWVALATDDFGGRSAEQAFRVFDSNVDNRLDQREFVSACRQSFGNWRFLETSSDEEEVAESMLAMFAKADVDHDGYLNSQEFHFAGFLLSDFMVSETTRRLFDRLDRDGDGRISTHEVARRGVAPVIRTAFSTADRNRDGVLDWDEATKVASFLLETGHTPDKR